MVLRFVKIYGVYSNSCRELHIFSRKTVFLWSVLKSDSERFIAQSENMIQCIQYFKKNVFYMSGHLPCRYVYGMLFDVCI